MKICVIGTGYVGLVAGTCFSEMGNTVICVDKDKNKLENLKNGIMPIFEPGLEELIVTNVGEKRLFFSDSISDAVKKSDLCFIAVGTPQCADGSAELSSVFEVVDEIGNALNGYKVIVNKSTVPVGTAQKMTERLKALTNHEFDVVSNPEFLKQGAAVEDFLKPDRVIIGSDSEKSTAIMKELYSPFLRMGNPVIVMDVKSAEMTKYASNSFLAMKVSFANEIANICEKVGADAELVRIGMCSDKRIGTQFLFSGIGYGGSCFPKDVKALLKTAKENGCEHSLLSATDDVNRKQKILFANKILNKYGNDLSGKVFAVWGLAFKPNTNDMREAPSIVIINELLQRGAQIVAYDPKAMNSAKIHFGDSINYAKSSYDALKNADALLLLTEWNEFRRPDFAKMKSLMKSSVIFDGRNQYLNLDIGKFGFEYHTIGRKCRNELFL